MTEQLKPCPFCGSPARLNRSTGESLWSHDQVEWTQVQCTNEDCGVATENRCEGWEPTPIQSWNTRALTAAQPAQEVAAVNTREQTFQNGYRIGYQAGRASLPTQPAAQTDSMGMPTSCGKPLCSPDEHHPLCRLHKPAAQATPEPVGEPTEGEFFAWDPEGGHAFYKTRQEAIEHAEESLRYYLDGANDHVEWDEDVEQIRWGIVMQRAMASNIGETEDGESSCDYELQDVATRPAPGVPEGFVLVPVEPTQAMLDALHSSVYLPGCYRAMLTAAQAKGADHG